MTVLARRLAKALFLIGAFLFIIVIAITLTNIFLRFFDSSLRGAIELSSYLSAAAMGLCLPQLQIQKAHANAGIFVEKLPKMLQEIQIFCVQVFCFAITLAISLELYDLTIFIHEGMEVVDGFNIPSALFTAILTLGLLGQCMIIGLELLAMLKILIKKIALFSQSNIVKTRA